MNTERVETEDLKKELILRIFKTQKEKYLTQREQRAMAVWLKAGTSGLPGGRAWSALRKLAREFDEFKVFLPRR